MSFEGRVALITGSGSGIGQAHAEVLSQRGCDIVVNDIVAEHARETARRVEANGRRAAVELVDVSDSAAVAAMVDRVAERFGKVDILVNNAGVAERLPMEEITDDRWDRMLRVHVYGAFYCARAVVPHMKAHRYGKIVNISSTWGMVGWADALHYSTAKAALLGFTKSLAKELAPWNINVNAIAPGKVWTPLPLKIQGEARMRAMAEEVPLKRWAEPREIGYLGAFLVSDEAAYLTGQVVSPNGGETIVGY